MKVFQFSAPAEVRKLLKIKNSDLQLLSSAFTCIYNAHRVKKPCKTKKFRIQFRVDRTDDEWGAYWCHNHTISFGKALLEKAKMRSFLKHLMIVIMHEMEHWTQHNVRRWSIRRMTAGPGSRAERQAYRAERYAKSLLKIYKTLRS